METPIIHTLNLLTSSTMKTVHPQSRLHLAVLTYLNTSVSMYQCENFSRATVQLSVQVKMIEIME